VPHADTLTREDGLWVDQQWLADLAYWEAIGSEATRSCRPSRRSRSRPASG